MGLYIPGLNLPRANQELWVAIQSDGSLRYNSCGWHDSQQKAIEVQPHGQLIDADALEIEAQKRMLICNKYDNQFEKPYEIMRAIALAPTIIPAEEAKESGAPAPACCGGALSAKHYSILCCCIGRLDGMREAIPKAARPFYDDTLDLLAALAREIRPVLKSE